MNFVGQNKEDEIVYNYFKNRYGADFKGSVLDIGANDGITLSNSYVLIQNGWNGYLVEAGRKPFSLLYNLHAENDKVKSYNIALHNYNGIVNFQESGSLITANDIGLVSSIVPTETERWRQSGVQFSEYEVTVYNFDTFINAYGLESQKFDFISIDIEGVDYEVLSQMDLNQLDCKCLCVEFNGKEKEKYVNYATKFGLNLIHQNPENLIFVR